MIFRHTSGFSEEKEGMRRERVEVRNKEVKSPDESKIHVRQTKETGKWGLNEERGRSRGSQVVDISISHHHLRT